MRVILVVASWSIAAASFLVADCCRQLFGGRLLPSAFWWQIVAANFLVADCCRHLLGGRFLILVADCCRQNCGGRLLPPAAFGGRLLPPTFSWLLQPTTTTNSISIIIATTTIILLPFFSKKIRRHFSLEFLIQSLLRNAQKCQKWFFLRRLWNFRPYYFYY